MQRITLLSSSSYFLLMSAAVLLVTHLKVTANKVEAAAALSELLRCETTSPPRAAETRAPVPDP